jgi:hypothetical protein
MAYISTKQKEGINEESLSMLRKAKEIIQGWWNYFLNKEIPVEKQRIAICNRCPLNNNGNCDKKQKGPAEKDFIYQGAKRYAGVEYYGCGCPLSKKVKSVSTKCPLGKW